MKHNFVRGDLVWWTMGAGDTPLQFEKGVPFIGIVTNVSKTAEGVEVYWFNNNIFKVLNCDSLMKANISQS